MLKGNRVYPHGKKQLTFIDLLENFYHLSSKKYLWKSLVSDIATSLFMQSGSGLFTSLLRGVYFRLFVNYQLPALVGRSIKIINRYNIKIKSNFWAKDDVTLFAGGPLEIGKACVFCDRSSVWSGAEGVFFGDRCSLGIGSYICGTEGKIKIGNDVIMADHVRIYSWDHKFSRSGVPFSGQKTSHKGVIIGSNCWLGSGVIIVDGVKLGNNCVVGAGSVVTRSFSDNSLIAGVPAKIIKKVK